MNATCPKCMGKRTIPNPAIDFNGIPTKVLIEDPEFEEDYHAGVYDVSCPVCNGGGVLTQTQLYEYYNLIDDEYDPDTVRDKRHFYTY